MWLKENILDLLFPIECLGCGKEKVWLCEDCLANIPININFKCPVCQSYTKVGEVCPACQGKINLDGIFIASSYDNQLLRQAIHRFKYNYVTDLAIPLSAILARFLSKIKKSGLYIVPNILINYQASLIIPVPLHKKRIRSRGFNQADLLADKVATCLEFKKANILSRRYQTQPQVNLKRRSRLENLKGVFVCSDREIVKDKKIILIDDVATTGATLEEGARVLKQAGAREVWGLVLARG